MRALGAASELVAALDDYNDELWTGPGRDLVDRNELIRARRVLAWLEVLVVRVLDAERRKA